MVDKNPVNDGSNFKTLSATPSRATKVAENSSSSSDMQKGVREGLKALRTRALPAYGAVCVTEG